MPQTSATAIPALGAGCPGGPALPAALPAEGRRARHTHRNAQPSRKAASIPVRLGTELRLRGHPDL